jgi:hypothetical protein
MAPAAAFVCDAGHRSIDIYLEDHYQRARWGWRAGDAIDRDFASNPDNSPDQAGIAQTIGIV